MPGDVDELRAIGLRRGHRPLSSGLLIEQCSAGRFDDLAHLVRHVGWQIVDNHDVTRPQRWCQALRLCVAFACRPIESCISRIVAAVESEISRSSAARQFAVSVKCDFESFVYGWHAALLFRSAL
jgi:hypothetical protein